MPEAASRLSTPRSIIPTMTTNASPTLATTRKLELVSSAVMLRSVRKEPEARLAAKPITNRKISGRRM